MNRSLRRTLRPSISPLHLAESAGRLAGILGVSAAIAFAAPAFAGPQNPQVVRGSASFHQHGNTTTIHAANNTIINHHAFNIGAGETVRFVQPSSTSRVLNRITGPDPSTIAGTLQSNGIVYIANPAGVYFANGALVDVGGIYAAAGRISNADFLDNINRFTLTGAVDNHGHIIGREVHLLGQRVANLGTIVAPDGIVTMTAGDEVMLSQAGGQIMARISGGGGETGVTQAGEIDAQRGRIAIGAGDMYALAIDHRGTSRAREVTLEGGKEGVVSVSGKLDASSTTGEGGTVKVLGERVGLFDGSIDASGQTGGGTVFVGGNLMGQGPEQNARAVYTSPDSIISADAVETGTGGNVILWSDEVSRLHGKVSARGGARGGDGGFVETSSARELYVTRTPDVTASRSTGSRGGTWLIDPEDLTIVPGGDETNITTTPPPPASIFTSSGSGAELGVELIRAALTGGANVEVRTGTGGPTDGGTITLHADTELDYSGTGENTLSLIAHRDIILDGMIFRGEGASDRLNLILTADSEGAGVGEIAFNNLLDTGGGFLEVNGISMTVRPDATIHTRGGNITTNLAQYATLLTDLDAGTGNITFNNAVVVGDHATLRGHDITFDGPVESSALDPFGLTIETVDGGTTRFNAPVGASERLDHLRISDDGQTILNTDSLRASAIDIDNPVELRQSLHVDGSSSIRFGQTINSESGQHFALHLSSPSTTLRGNLGGVSGGNRRLGEFKIDSGGSSAGSATIEADVRAQSVTIDTNLTLAGEINTTGDQTYNRRISLAGDSRLSTGSGAGAARHITFNDRIDSLTTDRELVLETNNEGIITFNASVGSVAPLREIRTTQGGTVVFTGGSVTTSGAQVYRNRIRLDGSTTILAGGATFHESIDSGAEPRSLTVNPTPGTIARFEKPIGANSPLNHLSIGSDGNTELNAGQVVTQGAQAFNNAVALGADTFLQGSAISFGRSLDSHSLIHNLTIDTPGQTTFGGSIGGSTALGQLTVQGNGPVLFSGPNITTTSHQTYNGPVRLGRGGTITFRSNSGDIAFLSTIDSTELLGEASLVVNTPGGGTTTFAGSIGATHMLQSLSTAQAGTTRLGANVHTSGQQRYNGRLVLSGDVNMHDSGAGGIAFRNTVDSDSTETPRALNIFVNDELNATPENPELPRIAFGGDVGLTTPLRSIHIGGPRATNPAIATIVGGIGSGDGPITNYSMFIKTTEGFTMGHGQKFTVLGDLTINAGGTALLGDITTLGNLTVESPDIAIRTRPSGQMLVREGASLVMRNDPGVDFVSARGINFSTTPRVLGDHNRPAFGTPQSADISTTLTSFPNRAVGPINLETMRLGTAYLDLRAAGPGNTNVAEAIAGADPSPEMASGPDEVAHGDAQLAELAQMGLQVRTEDEDAALPFLATAVHDDASGLLASDARVTSRRLPPGAAARVLVSYRTLFYGQSHPPQDAESRAEHISQVLAQAWAEYSDSVGRRADAIGFRAYCEAVPAQSEALHYLNSLREIFTELGYLGLTSAEVRKARQQIVRSIAFPGLSPAQLETAIMATYLGAKAAPRQTVPVATTH